MGSLRFRISYAIVAAITWSAGIWSPWAWVKFPCLILAIGLLLVSGIVLFGTPLPPTRRTHRDRERLSANRN